MFVVKKFVLCANNCLAEYIGTEDNVDNLCDAKQVRGWTAVHYSSLKGWTETTRVLLDSNKALVNVKTPGDKKTPLDLAVQSQIHQWPQCLLSLCRPAVPLTSHKLTLELT